MKINHMICPLCGHDFYTDCAYGTCDACQCSFYASDSRNSIRQISISNPQVQVSQLQDWWRA
jgi:hypothetical protein